MAVTQKGVWDLQDVRDKQLQSQWDYTSSGDAGKLFMWGRNDEAGQLGVNDIVTRSSPIQVGTDQDWQSVGVGRYVIAGVRGNKLYTWGPAGHGALGLNGPTNVAQSSPTQVGTDTDWSKVGPGGSNQAMAIKSDGTLWSWGYNAYGSLGHNDMVKQSSPTQVGTDTTWSDAAIVEAYTANALKTDGTLWAWGYNGIGVLGQSQVNTHYSSPKQIPGTWSNFAGGYQVAGGVKTDGTLWCWGDGGYGSTGQNDNVDRSSPTQVGTDTTWSKLRQGYHTNIALKTDGTIWTWGQGNDGMLGRPDDNLEVSSPTQVGTDTTWTNVDTTMQNMYATKTDGTLWTWGAKDYGMLGLNQNNVAYSSPTQIPGTNWSLDVIRGSDQGSYVGAISL